MTKKQVARRQENPRTWFRSERVFLLRENTWYFRTREGVELGPYDSRFEAEVEAGVLKEMLKDLKSDAARHRVIKDFILDAYEGGHKLSPQFREARSPGRMGAVLAAV